MTVSAPSLSFSPTSLDFGSIATGASCAMKSFVTTNKSNATSTFATAKNISISFETSTNSTEAESEQWVAVSTATERCSIRSMDVGPECRVPSIVSGASINTKTKVRIPASPTTTGTVYFKYHIRYQYTG